jgi:hypothetical protein
LKFSDTEFPGFCRGVPVFDEPSKSKLRERKKGKRKGKCRIIARIEGGLYNCVYTKTNERTNASKQRSGKMQQRRRMMDDWRFWGCVLL